MILYILLLSCRLKRRRQVEGLYEISTIPKDGPVGSAYLTMTGGHSPVLSPRLSNSTQGSSLEALIKCPRANMALPPTPTERLQSPPTMTSLVSIESGNDGTKGDEAEKVTPSPHLTVPDIAPQLPVAPVRSKKPNNPQNPTHFKFPPLQAQPSSSAPKRLSAGKEGARNDDKAVNGRVTHLDKRSHLLQQESTEDEEASLLYRNDEIIARHSHFNDEHDRMASVGSEKGINRKSARASTKQNTYEGI